MSKLNKVAVLFASVALAAPVAVFAAAHTGGMPKANDNCALPTVPSGKTAPTSCAGVMPAGLRPRPTRIATGP